MAYAYIGSMRAKGGQRDAVIDILLAGADGLRTAGCQVYAVCTDPADADVIWVSEVWTPPTCTPPRCSGRRRSPRSRGRCRC